jgi:hypothetical protein
MALGLTRNTIKNKIRNVVINADTENMSTVASAPPAGVILYIIVSGMTCISTFPSGTLIAINIRSAKLFGMKASAVRQAVVNTAAIIADINIRLAIGYTNYSLDHLFCLTRADEARLWRVVFIGG